MICDSLIQPGEAYTGFEDETHVYMYERLLAILQKMEDVLNKFQTKKKKRKERTRMNRCNFILKTGQQCGSYAFKKGDGCCYSHRPDNKSLFHLSFHPILFLLE